MGKPNKPLRIGGIGTIVIIPAGKKIIDKYFKRLTTIGITYENKGFIVSKEVRDARKEEFQSQ